MNCASSTTSENSSTPDGPRQYVVLSSTNSSNWTRSQEQWEEKYPVPSGIRVSVKKLLGTGRTLKQSVDKLITGRSPATRWIVDGDEELIRLCLTRLMHLKALEKHECAFLPPENTSVMRIYWASTPYGSTHALPLIRDERGTVLISPAQIIAQQQRPTFLGECYVDEHKIAGDTIRKIEIEPISHELGVRARTKKRFRYSRWTIGRAVQTGGVDFVSHIKTPTSWVSQPTRERVTYYRHLTPMNLVR